MKIKKKKKKDFEIYIILLLFTSHFIIFITDLTTDST